MFAHSHAGRATFPGLRSRRALASSDSRRWLRRRTTSSSTPSTERRRCVPGACPARPGHPRRRPGATPRCATSTAPPFQQGALGAGLAEPVVLIEDVELVLGGEPTALRPVGDLGVRHAPSMGQGVQGRGGRCGLHRWGSPPRPLVSDYWERDASSKVDTEGSAVPSPSASVAIATPTRRRPRPPRHPVRQDLPPRRPPGRARLTGPDRAGPLLAGITGVWPESQLWRSSAPPTRRSGAGLRCPSGRAYWARAAS